MASYYEKIEKSVYESQEDDEEAPVSEPFRKFCEREDVKELRSGQKMAAQRLAHLLDSMRAPKSA